MDEVEKKCGEVLDALYVANVRTDEHIHLDACPSMARDMVMVHVAPNHWRCEGCRSKGLIKTMIDSLVPRTDDRCTGCRQHTESNAFHARAKIADIAKALRGDYTVVDEHVSSIGTGHVYVQI